MADGDKMSRPAEIYHVEIPEIFEGPLDLLLHLIRKHELDIFDIPVSFLTERYLEYLDMMKQINLDLASDFLEMAATLAYIKSKMMLPRKAQEEEEDEEYVDPREELVRRLLEYQKYKEASEQLMEFPRLGRDTFLRGASEKIDVPEPELRPPGLFELMDALETVLKRTKAVAPHEVTRYRMTVAERIGQLADLIRERNHVVFEDIFETAASRFDVVVSFLALLEMTKLHMIRLYQPEHGGTIHIWLAVSDEEEEAAEDDTESGGGAPDQEGVEESPDSVSNEMQKTENNDEEPG